MMFAIRNCADVEKSLKNNETLKFLDKWTLNKNFYDSMILENLYKLQLRICENCLRDDFLKHFCLQ